MRLRQGVFAAAAGALCGVALWTSAGVLAVDTLAGFPRIVGLIPAFMTLATAAVLGAALATWTTSRGVPASLYLLPVVGSLAWTTVVSWPTMVAWAGPSVVIPFTLLGIGIVVSIRTKAGEPAWQRWIVRHIDSRWSPGIAATATALCLLAILTSATSLPVTGDEPHYLLVTQSILEDGDIDLTNNYDAETYRSFYAGPLLRHVTLGYLAEQYSFHGLALSVFLIPGFALGGVLGSRLLIVLITAVGAGFLWATARRVTDSAAAAWMGWLAMVSAAPFALHGILIYPDGVAAAVTSLAVWVLACVVVGRTPHTLAVVSAGVALSTLPWLHIRLSLSAGVFGLAMVWALAGRQRDLILPFLAAPIISFVLWIANTWVMFHTFDPTAAFREKAVSSFAQVPVGTLGLLFDAEYGLLTYAPVLLLSVLGAVPLWRRSRAITTLSVLLTLATLELGAAWVWWGGDSAPARFLIPNVPLIALCLAAWWADASSRSRSFTAATIAVGACVTACLAVAEHGAYILNTADGGRTIWEWLSPNADLSFTFPSLFRPGAQPGTEAMLAVTWMAAGAFGFALTRFWRGSSSEAPPLSWVRASTATIVWLSLGATLGWLQRDISPWTPDRGQLRMLYASTSPALSNGVRGRGWQEFDSRRSLAYFTSRESAVSSLSISTPEGGDTPVRLHVPFVPAGRYAIEVERPAGTRDLAAPRLSLSLGRNAAPAKSWFVTPSSEAPTFWLAVPVWSVHVETDSASDAPPIVRLRPQQVFAPSPFNAGYALNATIGGPIAVYAMDAYSSSAGPGAGFNVALNRPANFIVTDEQGHPVSFVVHVDTDLENATATVMHGTFAHTATVEPTRRRPMHAEGIVVPAQGEPLLPLRVTISGQPREIFGRLQPVRAVVRIFAE